MDNGLSYTDKGNGMSGWQRLGVVLSVIIALITISTNFDSFPTQKKALWELDNRVSLWSTCDKYYEDIEAGRKNTDSQCAVYTKEYVIEKIKVELNWYQGQLNTLTDRQVKFAAYYFAWWAGISLIMYLIAITMKWVYRGFRPKRV